MTRKSMQDVVAMFSEEKVDEQVPRFYLQFQSLRMKGSANGGKAYCKIQINTQRCYTEAVPCVKDHTKIFPVSALMSEGFVL
jgi:hypothetical protein